jgi:1,4-alpha-glucan branching enzyme
MAARPSWVGGLGFTTAWDECWSSDVLNYFGCDPIRRKYVHHVLERSADPPSGHRRVLALSHDVAARASLLGRMPGDRWQQFANVRAMLGLTFAEPGYKLLFMGNEFGQANPWNPHASLDWHLLGDPLHQGVQRWVGDLNRTYREQPALHGAPGEAKALDWIELRDAEQSVIAFLRQRDGHAPVLVIANLTPVPRYDYRIGVPHDGFWAELLGGDARIYGGSGVGNGGGVWAQPHPAHDRPASLMLTLPPLAVTLLRLQES